MRNIPDALRPKKKRLGPGMCWDVAYVKINRMAPSFWKNIILRIQVQLQVVEFLSFYIKNNYPLGKDVNVSIVVGNAAVPVTLSPMERPVKHKLFNFSLLRQSFKNYSHKQKVLVSILSLMCQILYCTSNLARFTVVSDATRQAHAMTSLSSMTA